MSDVAIRVDGLSKQYRIGKQESYRTFRDLLTDAMYAPFRRAAGLLQGNASAAANLNETIWALKDVSFEVKQGEIVGIIGRNGAGKSTLLKILSQITEPTEGQVDTYGRVGALLEVGTGFHQELTGRENIYLNGAILGMSREEIKRKFDEIVAFAEVEKFIDTPVKHYSSGMGLRLGFAVAAHLEPEILIVDEVLAVGDAAFQKKCLGKMSEVAQEGSTVLFVSHNMNAIEMLCKKAVWLEKGQVVELGQARDLIGNYLAAVADGRLFVSDSDAIQIKQVVLRNQRGEIVNGFEPGDDLDIGIQFYSRDRQEHPVFIIGINGKYGVVCAANMLLDGESPDMIEGDSSIGVRFHALPILPQFYTVSLGIRTQNDKYIFDNQEIAAFHVSGDLATYGLKGKKAQESARVSVPLVQPYEWYDLKGNITPVSIHRASILE